MFSRLFTKWFIYYVIFFLVNNPFGIDSFISAYNPLQNNQIIFQDTTLYCITETNLPWSYVDLAGNRTVLNTTVDANTGISILAVTTDNPGYYSCQADGRIYTVGFFDPTNSSSKLYILVYFPD